MLTRRLWVLLSPAIVCTFRAGAQVNPSRGAGEATLRERLQPVMRQIYEARGERRYLIRREGLPGLESDWTEATGYNIGKELSRVVAAAWTPWGKYAVEYYLRAGSLVFVYETLTYFDDHAPPNAWINFQGMAAWERRLYFENDAIGYEEVVGTGMRAGRSARALQLDARALVAELQRRPLAR